MRAVTHGIAILLYMTFSMRLPSSASLPQILHAFLSRCACPPTVICISLLAESGSARADAC